MNTGPRIGLVHALYASIAPMASALAEVWPEAEGIDLYDGSLYRDFAREGRTTRAMAGRIAELLRLSAGSGARGIVFTGSLFGEAVANAADGLRIPVLGAYDALIEEGLDAGTRLAILATLDATARALETDLHRAAADRGTRIALEVRVVDGAFAALQRGDSERHDDLVADALAHTGQDADAVLLGQYSLSPVLSRLPPHPHPPVLSGPHAAARRLRAQLG